MGVEIIAGRRLKARVVKLLLADGDGFETRLVQSLSLSFDGIDGDVHSGSTRRSGGREPWYRRGTEISNERQISIVAEDELAVAAAALGIESIAPEWIGANMVIEDVRELSWLPPRTRLMFEGGATIAIEGQNAPCRIAGRSIVRHNPAHPSVELGFATAAKHCRGLVGWVEKPGVIHAGAAITVNVPAQRLYRSSHEATT